MTVSDDRPAMFVSDAFDPRLVDRPSLIGRIGSAGGVVDAITTPEGALRLPSHDEDVTNAGYIGFLVPRLDDQARTLHQVAVVRTEYEAAVARGVPTLIFVARTRRDMGRERDAWDSVFKVVREFRDEIEQRAERDPRHHVAQIDDPYALQGPATAPFDPIARFVQEIIVRRSRPEAVQGPSIESELAVAIPRPPGMLVVGATPGSDQVTGFGAELNELAAWTRARAGNPLMILDGPSESARQGIAWSIASSRYAGSTTWGGRVWYDFGRPGANLRELCALSLSYFRGVDPRVFDAHTDMALRGEFFGELRLRPWLVVLHRIDGLSDGQAVSSNGRPHWDVRIDDFLRQLAGARPSKIVLTCEAPPKALAVRAGEAIHGVSQITMGTAASPPPLATPLAPAVPDDPLPGPRRDYFVSYSAKDELVARRVVDLLERAGFTAFVQFRDIPVGSNFVREMNRGLRASDRFIALLSPDYEHSPHCQAEWAAAYNDDPDGAKRKLVPLLIEPTDLNFLARQVVYANLCGLEGEAFEQRMMEAVQGGRPIPEPVRNLASPVRHGWTEAGRLTVLHSARPQADAGRGPGDVRKQLASVRTLAGRLAERAGSAEFNHSRQYLRELQAYLEDVPTTLEDGNIYLADAAARTLREMFAAEASVLPIAFAAPLKTFLESHLGLRAYYPEVADFHASVRDGQVVGDLAPSIVARVQAAIDAHTPSAFEPSVGRELKDEAEAAPPLEVEQDLPELGAEAPVPLPPPDPIAEVDRGRSRDQLVARSLNGLWSTFLKGRELSPDIGAWRRAYESLEPSIRPVLAFLRQTLGAPARPGLEGAEGGGET